MGGSCDSQSWMMKSRRLLRLAALLLALFATCVVGSSQGQYAEVLEVHSPLADPQNGVTEPRVDLTSDQQGVGERRTAEISDEVVTEVEASGNALVIVGLRAPLHDVKRIAAIANEVISTLPEGSYEGVAQEQSLPFVVLKVDDRSLDALRSNQNVTSVVINRENSMSLASSVPAIGGDISHSSSIVGLGTAVAVLDNGVQRDHPFLSDGNGHTRVFAEACFSGYGMYNYSNVQSVCPGRTRTAYGAGAAAPISSCRGDGCSHGTHVAGIAAGGSAVQPDSTVLHGVAPSASIIAIQVFTAICDGVIVNHACPGVWRYSAFDSDIALALDYVDQLSHTVNIAAANISIGSTMHYSRACDSSSALAAPMKRLRDDGVAPIVASGNEFSKAGISHPACLSAAVSVGSSDTGSGQVSSFSNSAPILSLLAPGDRSDGLFAIVSSGVSSSYMSMRGTSMAAPHVAGAFALMRQALPGASVDEMLRRFVITGSPKADSNGVVTPLINVRSAIIGPSIPDLAIKGQAVVNSRLTGTATVISIPDASLDAQWFRCNSQKQRSTSLSAGCTAIVEATSQTYVPSSQDVGFHLVVRFSAANPQRGTISTYSASIGPITNQIGAPDVPSVAPHDREVTVSWEAPADGGSALGAYEIATYLDGVYQSSMTVGAIAQSASVSGLINGRNYRFAVRAKDSSRQSQWSDQSREVTPVATQLGQMTSLNVGGTTMYDLVSDESGSLWVNYLTIFSDYRGSTDLAVLRPDGSMQRFTNLPISNGSMVAGPDGNIWVRGNAVSPAGKVVGEVPYADEVVVGSDGNFWTVSVIKEEINRVTPQGSVTAFSYRSGSWSLGYPQELTLGPDGNVWFTTSSGWIGRVTPSGEITRFQTGTTASLNGITAGADGNLWFAVGSGLNLIGKMTLEGQSTLYSNPAFLSPSHLTTGADGAIWFTMPNSVGRLTIGNSMSVSTYTSNFAFPQAVVAGQDGRVWVIDADAGQIKGFGTGRSSIPTHVTAKPTLDGALVSWSAPTSDGGSPISSYVVTASPGGRTCTWNSGPLQCTFTGLSSGASYTFSVVAFNGSGPGVKSSSTSSIQVPQSFTPVTPTRVFDTRPGKSGVVSVSSVKVGDTYELRVPVTNLSGLVPATGVGAVSLNVTATQTEGVGFVTVYPCGSRPNASNLNYAGGQTVANAVIAPVSGSGEVCFYSKVPAHLIADVNGWFASGSSFTPVTPTRVFDTRPGKSGVVSVSSVKVGDTYELRVPVTNLSGLVPATGVGAVSLNVTATQTEGVGFVTVYPCGSRPNASNLNYAGGQTVANAVIAPVSGSGEVCFYSKVPAHLIADVNGWFAN